MARPPKSTALKLYQGEDRPEQLRVTPKPARGQLRAPRSLTVVQRGVWDAVVAAMADTEIFTPADVGILTRYCVMTERWMLAEQAITEHGALYELAGKLTPNPAVGMARDLTAELRRIEVELGLTPAARNKIGAKPEGSGKAAIEALLRAK